MTFFAEQPDASSRNDPASQTWVERGCLFHLAIFIFGGLGTCLATMFAVGLGVMTFVDNGQNDWYRKNGCEYPATIVRIERSKSTRSGGMVGVYSVNIDEQIREFREESNVFRSGEYSVGDKLRVWVAGDRARRVHPNGSVLRAVFSWPCVGPAVSVPILAWMVYLRWRRYGRPVTT